MKYTIAYNLNAFSNGLYLPSAHIVKLDDAGILSYIQKEATVDNLSEFELELTSTAKKLLDIVDLLAPKNLEKKYNANPKKPILLALLLADPIVFGKMSEFVHRHLGDFLQTILHEKLPICLDIKSKVLAHLTQLTPNSTILQPQIYFEQNAEGMIYRLRMKENNQAWRIQEKLCTLVCNEPAWIVRDQQLYHIEGINSGRLKPFFTKDEVVIPQNKLKEYCQKVILPLVEKVDFEHHGFTILPYNSIQKATLSIVHNFIAKTYSITLNFDYEKINFNWKEARLQKSFLDFDEKEQVVIHHVKRNLEAENVYIQTLKNLDLSNQESNYFSIKAEKNSSISPIIDWFLTHQNTLLLNGFDVEKIHLDNKNIALVKPQLNLKVTQENDWFDLKGDVILGAFTVPFAQLTPYIRDQNPYFLLPDNTYFIIPEEWLETYKGVAQFGKNQANTIKIAKSQAPALLDNALLISTQNLDNEQVTWEAPQYLKADLRPYQIEGVQWLLSHYRNNLGACLADDMGLGKTLQTIATLLYAKEHKKEDLTISKEDTTSIGLQVNMFETAPKDDFFKPLQALIVVPASLVYNWESEWKKFAPVIMIYRHIGTSRNKDIRIIRRFDVVLTTYQTVAKDVALLEKLTWEYIVLDESQYIKNKESDAFKAVNRLPAKHKISLSGTPIENSLADLWSQMEFINPGLLGGFSFFDKGFIKPIEKEQSEAQKELLRNLVKPYLLRRTKEEVAKDLPPVVRQIVYSDMGDAQRKVYEKEKSSIRNLLLGVELAGKSSFEYQNIVVQSLTKLRQLAIHPKLVFEDYAGESAKFDDVLATWDAVRRANHKMLLFSFYVKNLDLYKTHFEKKTHKYALLSGDTSLEKRNKEIIEFQEKEDIQTFLISLTAGGVGINLTAADYVFLLDPWWNPAKEEQAIARAHRIGQTKTVMVYKFITKDTIEEKILLLQERKQQLAADIIEGASMPQFSKDDLAFLLA
jgi:SNF2 family DNA or RNA helicase